MNISFWISRKLRLNNSKHGANATGVVISVTGVALALIIMEFTIAIVLGFKQQITEKVLGLDGEIWVLPDYDYSTSASAATMTPDSLLLATIDSVMPGAITYQRYNQPGILKTDNDFAGVYFDGFDSDYDMAFEKGNLVEGIWPDYSQDENSDKIVISTQISNSLGLNVGDKVNACFFVNEAIKSRRFEIVGLYNSGFGELDRTIIYADISTLRRIEAADSTSCTRLVIDVAQGTDIEQKSSMLQQSIIDKYQSGISDKLYPVDNVMHTGAIYFNWLELLNTNVVVIFLLMICVSGFTLISSMFIIILERIPTIGILRSLGATKSQIRKIFIYMTMKIVGRGLLIGNAIGLILLYIQMRFKVMTLDPDMYYLRYVPIQFNLFYFLLLNIGVIFVSWLILILPSRVASNVSPAVTMRFD